MNPIGSSIFEIVGLLSVSSRPTIDRRSLCTQQVVPADASPSALSPHWLQVSSDSALPQRLRPLPPAELPKLKPLPPEVLRRCSFEQHFGLRQHLQRAAVLREGG